MADDLPTQLQAAIAARDAAPTKRERRALSERVKLLRSVIAFQKRAGWPLTVEREKAYGQGR